MKRRILALAGGTALAAAALTPTGAQGAATLGNTAQRAAAACSIWLGSVTPEGAHTSSRVVATAPPSVQGLLTTQYVFGPGQVRLSSRFVSEPDIAGLDRYGF